MSRTHFVVCTDYGVLTRIASEERVKVDFKAWPNPKKPDLFNQACKENLFLFFKLSMFSLFCFFENYVLAWSARKMLLNSLRYYIYI